MGVRLSFAVSFIPYGISLLDIWYGTSRCLHQIYLHLFVKLLMVTDYGASSGVIFQECPTLWRTRWSLVLEGSCVGAPHLTGSDLGLPYWSSASEQRIAAMTEGVTRTDSKLLPLLSPVILLLLNLGLVSFGEGGGGVTAWTGGFATFGSVGTCHNIIAPLGLAHFLGGLFLGTLWLRIVWPGACPISHGGYRAGMGGLSGDD